MDNLSVRKTILDLEQCMLESENQVDLPVYHHKANNVYGRELFIPKGVTVMGKLHRFPCINVIAEGSVVVVTEHGRFEYKAPDVFVSPAGTKRAIHAVKDTTWITFHPCTDETLPELEQKLIAESYLALEEK